MKEFIKTFIPILLMIIATVGFVFGAFYLLLKLYSIFGFWVIGVLLILAFAFLGTMMVLSVKN